MKEQKVIITMKEDGVLEFGFIPLVKPCDILEGNELSIAAANIVMIIKKTFGV